MGALITGVDGGLGVKSVSFDRGRGEEHIDCDFVAMSGGFNPNVQLACQRGAKPLWNEALQAFVQGLAIPQEAREQLLAMTPANYLGIAERLARDI